MFRDSGFIVTFLCAAVPLMEVAANKDEAFHVVSKLAVVLGKREWFKYFSRVGAAESLRKEERKF